VEIWEKRVKLPATKCAARTFWINLKKLPSRTQMLV